MADLKESPVLPLMMRLKLSIGSFIFQFLRRSDGTINRRLVDLLDLKTPAGATAVVGGTLVSSADISIDPSRQLWFRLFLPETTGKLPLIIHFHGGGFSCFQPDSKTVDGFCRTLAGKVHAAVASVNYRLAPEHKYPCQYDDALDALRFIDSQSYAVLPPEVDLSRCFLIGDSAGANIAHHAALMALEKPHAFDKITLAGIVAVQPFFGGEERTESELRLRRAPILNAEGADALWRMFLPAGEDRDHAAVNVFGGANAIARVERVRRVDFPRNMVVVGGFDPLQDWQRRYVEGLKKCGKEVELVEYCNAFHSFYAFEELPEFGMLMEDVGKFINKY